jgi:hypothetical protein
MGSKDLEFLLIPKVQTYLSDKMRPKKVWPKTVDSPKMYGFWT